MTKGKKIISIIIAAFIIGTLFFNEIILFITDFQWFQDLGYEKVFLKKIQTQLMLGLPIFFLSGFFYYYYFRFMKNRYEKKIASFHQTVSNKTINRWLLLPAGLMAFITATSIAGQYWWQLLTFRHQVPFEVNDPVFGNDLAWYFFTWPLLREGLGTFIALLFMLVLITAIFFGAMVFLRRPTLVEVSEGENPRTQMLNRFLSFGAGNLVVLGVLFFLTTGARYFVSLYEILYSPQGAVYGASFTDIKVNLPLYRIQMAVSIGAALLLWVGYQKKKKKLMIAAPILLLVVSILGQVLSIGVERFMVEPNVLARETPYIERNIEFTRKAYGLNDVHQIEFDVDYRLTREDLEKNPQTINNIRINDYRPALESYNQLQAIRPYYQFKDVDIDRYTINDEYRQVFLSARELNMDRISDSAKTWLNMHLKYTHGYGAVMSPVNQVTTQGQPELFIRNIPPVSVIDKEITRPEIYFGELTNHYIIVNTDEMEFDYPMGEDNAETRFEGEAGVELKGINRALYALRERNFRIFLSGSISGESRIIFDRNVMDRVTKIAPFLHYDEDPYLIVHEGRLYWMMDAFTLGDKYPYATPYMEGKANYIRNSVKVVVDAYHGTTDFYIAEPEDPVIQTYSNIFPELFQPLEAMPEGLRQHIRYPQELFDIQTVVYERYHMSNPSVFYLDEDLWNIAQERYSGQFQPVESQYMIYSLPEEEEEEFLLSVPYTPNRLNNMVAKLVARSDGEHYGELVLYRMPKDRNIYGPRQIEARIDQNERISQSLTLWGEGGSEVIRGNLLVIPVENSLLYVEPLYIRAANSESPPEVKQVIAAFGDDIVMENTLEEALESLFGAGPPSIPEEDEVPEEALPEDETSDPEEIPAEEPEERPSYDFTDATVQEIIQEANRAFDEAQEASQQGDWAAYGEALERLEEALRRLEN
ncbi:hypothetical protein SAMN05192551_10867 [Tindallia magadiensis]|uniref:UPF0182 protein SAMN05192551_10867 n=1 Tax=Tindallia magadiensis TaxID=69895 RepID=A0A1I3G9D8_9FIRM|nr:UPF0182 family protein [Tindallia magadiensis]SFI20017.1 hypothetical protein SAMN05192551_10867 [Tindallia magadiensis]